MFKRVKAGAMLALMLCAAMAFVGCNNLQETSEPADGQKVELGSIKIVQRDSFRSLSPLSNITSAKVTVTGTGIGEISLGTVSLNGFANGVIVNGVPTGTNRIITLQGLDSDGKEVTGLKYRAVSNVTSSTTDVVIDESTTAVGNVFAVLLIEEIDLATVNVSAIESAIDSSVGFARINAQQLAYDYIDGVLGSASDYVLASGLVVFDCYLADGTYSAEVNDSSSATLASVSAGSGIEIAGVAPGAWTFYLYDGEGNVVYQISVNVESGKATDLGAIYDEGIVIVVDAEKYSAYNRLYAWVNNSPILAGWPGVQMLQNGKYYVYQIKDYSSVGVLVNTAGGLKLVSGDMTIAGEGVYVISSSSSGTLTAEETYAYTEKQITKRNTATDIVVHAYDRVNVWAWNANGVSGNVFASWPGQAMISEGNGWYKWTFEDTESLMVMFNNGSNSGKTEETQLSEAGSYWWKEGTWYRENPDGPVAPVVTVSLDSGTYSSAKTVTLSSSNEGDKIYYTLDGTEPTASSTVYSSALTISETSTLKAVSYNAESALWSEVITRNYTINIVENEKIIVHAYQRTYVWAWNANGVSGNVFASWPGQKMIAEGNDLYGWTFEDTSSLMIMFNNGGEDGKTAEKSLTHAGEYWYVDGIWSEVNPFKPATPVVSVSLPGGTYNTEKKVTLSSTNSSDVIYYTLDGTEPTAESAVYSSPVTISESKTLKAIAYNAEADIQWSGVVTVIYVIDPNADFEAPEIEPSVPAGRYTSEVSVNFTIKDNKDNGITVYYTTDGSLPTSSSAVYAACGAGSDSVTGNSISVVMNESKTIRILAVDAAGNGTTQAFYYNVSKIDYKATRWDPRQETIYFLLTARWFDGDAANTVKDQWCSSDEDPAWRGDFKGLVEKMDYIKALGFTCIWITPVVQNRGPLCYHGYHAWDMYKEDARLISPGYDFQRVIDEAHARGMKICLDVVLQHSGRLGLKDFAEIKYNRDPLTYPVPVGWENFEYDEAAYEAAYSVTNKTGIASVQHFPNNWEYDGLKSPGVYPAGYKIDGVDVGGQPIPPYADFVGDVRPFTAADLQAYSYLAMNSTTASPYQWPKTESYQLTIDTGDFTAAGVNGQKTANYTYDQYVASPKLHFHGWANGFNDSGMFDKYPDANLRSIHEDCPDLNTESTEVQEYVIGAYKRYIDMGVDMFRVDTVMHIDKQTLNDHFWPAFMEEAAGETAKKARGGADFFMFGEVANFINNMMNDKPAPIRQCNYTWDNTVCPESCDISSNHLLNGNSYRSLNYSHKAVPESEYLVSTIDIVSHNGFCDGVGNAYGRALGNDGAYNDATYLTWYTDSHDYGPNKYLGRWNVDESQFAAAWSMMFTYRGIPIVYYGSEIHFAQGKHPDYPGSIQNTINNTGRAYYGDNLAGSVTASDFGKYTASGTVASTLNAELSKHLRDLNKIRLAVPALQMGQYSTEGHSGGWAGYKRRYTGKNKITGENVDSYVLVGVGAGNHSFSGVLNGTYVDVITGGTMTVSGGYASFTAHGSGDAALGVWALTGLASPVPAGGVCSESPYLGF